MSIEYTIFEDDDLNGKVVFSVSLSNTTHAAWQEEVGLHRQMKNLETGEAETWLVNTTIHDNERQCFEVGWVQDYQDKCIKEGREPNPLLVELLEYAYDHDCTLVYV